MGWLTAALDDRVKPALSRRICERVASATWHESQELKHLSDGGVELRLLISEAIKIRPWILGSGKECEVVAPAELRNSIASELEEALATYETMALTRSMAG